MSIAVQAIPHFNAAISQNKQKNQVKGSNYLATIPQMNPNKISLLNTTYSQLFVNKKAVSFGDSFTDGPKPISNPPSVIAPKIELQDRINAAIAMMGKDDIVVVSKDLSAAKKSLVGQVGRFDVPVKSVQLIADSQVSGSFMISKNDSEILALTNLDSKDMTIKDSTTKAHIPAGKSIFVSEKYDYSVDNKNFKFDFNGNAAQIPLEELNIDTFDFSKQDGGKIVSINTKRFESMGVQEQTDKKLIKFADVGGQDTAINELKKSIIYPLKFPSAYKNNIINRGIVLTGGPGTGKTLMAEAIANECDAHFMKLNGLEMESKWVGQTEENWRNLFQEAKDNQPSIIFIDEFDAVAKNRTGSDTGRHDDKTVNQLLTLMSDLEKGNDDVFVIVATNKIDLIDPAISRSGRFGKHVQVNNPDLAGCKKILDIHTKNLPVGNSFNKDEFAKELFDAKASGADIAYIANEANSYMYERSGVYEKMENNTFTPDDIDALKIEKEDFEKALDAFKNQDSDSKPKQKIKMGFQPPEEKSLGQEKTV